MVDEANVVASLASLDLIKFGLCNEKFVLAPGCSNMLNRLPSLCGFDVLAIGADCTGSVSAAFGVSDIGLSLAV